MTTTFIKQSMPAAGVSALEDRLHQRRRVRLSPAMPADGLFPL